MPVESKVEVRDAILDATNDLLARYGYRRLTVEDIAVEAGIGKGTIYLHFPSKEEVVLSTIDRLVERLTDRLDAIAGGPGTVPERLETILVTRVLYRFDHRHHDSKSMDELLSALRAAFLARRERYFAAEEAVIARVLAEGRARNILTLEDTSATAHLLVLATNSLLPYSLSVPELGKRSQVAAQAAALASLLVRGLRARRAPHVPSKPAIRKGTHR